MFFFKAYKDNREKLGTFSNHIYKGKRYKASSFYKKVVPFKLSIGEVDKYEIYHFPNGYFYDETKWKLVEVVER